MSSEIDIGLSMLFSLGDPFPSLLKRLREVDVRIVEILDEGLHTLNSRRVNALKRVKKSCGLELTLHAPFADVNIAATNSSLRRMILKRLEKSFLYARQLDCRLLVFHPGLKMGVSSFNPSLDWQLNLDSVHTLLKAARRQNVKIAIENVPEPYPFLMKNVDDFSRFYEELGEDVGLTLDIGHANLNHQIQDFINQLSDRIVHVHASDNNGTQDSHLGIGYGTIDWKEAAMAIKKARYSGFVILESIDHVEESLQSLRKFFS